MIAPSGVIEHIEARAYADLLRAAPPAWQCVAEETAAGWLLLAPAVDLLLFNRVIGCGLDAPAQRDDVEALVERFRAAGVKNFGVQLSPDATPDDVAGWLDAAGLSVRDRWTKVCRDASPAPPPSSDVRVTAVGTDHDSVFAEVTTRGFGMPPAFRPWIASLIGRPGWTHYLAWIGDEAIAGAALFVHEETGWLGMASTLPAARRRGAQGALMARRIADGRECGCRWLVTETAEDTPTRPNPSFRNMMRAGFRVAYQRPNFMLPGG